MQHTNPTPFGVGAQALAYSLIPSNPAPLIQAAMRAGTKPRMPGLSAMPGTTRNAFRRDRGALAVFCVEGVFAQGEHPLSWLLGEVNVVPLTEAIREAADDPSIRAIVFRVNSPGGDVAGMSDLVAAVTYATTRKSVHAIANDSAAAGAYWMVSGASELVATPTGIVGSIGVAMPPLIDVTGKLAKDGVRAFNAKTGANKGAGAIGEAVTPAIREEYQAIANGMAEPFFRAVAAGRRMSVAQVKALEGALFIGPDAQARGLVDRIVPSLTAYVDELALKYRRPAPAPAAKAGARATPRPAAVVAKPAPHRLDVAMEAEMKANGYNRTKALGAVLKREPHLHQEWVRREVARRDAQLKHAGHRTPPPGKVPI